MADRNTNRNRRGRNPNNDWDWYFYEYRYTPYGYAPYRGNDYSGRDYSERDYYDNTYYGRNYDYNRREYDRDFYGSSYAPYGRDFDRDYESGYGNYSGYGPRDYRRSDDRIREDVNDRLTWHSGIDATDIQVEVSEGTVTLTGSVDSRQDKRLAEDITESVSGVWDVNNQLRVRNRGYYRGWQGTGSRGEIHEGMEVVDTQGERVGEVKQVRDSDFLVDRPMARDVFVPFSECEVSGGQVRLNVRASEVDSQGWAMPEPTESQRSQKKR